MGYRALDERFCDLCADYIARLYCLLCDHWLCAYCEEDWHRCREPEEHTGNE